MSKYTQGVLKQDKVVLVNSASAQGTPLGVAPTPCNGARRSDRSYDGVMTSTLSNWSRANPTGSITEHTPTRTYRERNPKSICQGATLPSLQIHGNLNEDILSSFVDDPEFGSHVSLQKPCPRTPRRWDVGIGTIRGLQPGRGST